MVKILGAVGATLLIMVAASGTALAQATSWCSAGGAWSSCPVYNNSSPVYYFTSIPNGSAVAMICWRDSVSHTVNYSSNRWFKGYNVIVGTQWFHSSTIYNQTTVPRC